jgi:hypothetical protein
VEPQRPLSSRKDPGCELGPPCLALVPGRLLEPGSQDEQPGQGPRKELHLGRQGGALPIQGQMGNADPPPVPRRAGGHRPQVPIGGLARRAFGQRACPRGGTMERTGLPLRWSITTSSSRQGPLHPGPELAPSGSQTQTPQAFNVEEHSGSLAQCEAGLMQV